MSEQEKQSTWKRVRNIIIATAGVITFIVGILSLIFGALDALPDEITNPIYVRFGILDPTATPTNIFILPITQTPSHTPTEIYTPSSILTDTPLHTPTATLTYTSTYTSTATLTQSHTPPQSCEGEVVSETGASLLTLVRSIPNANPTITIHVGQVVSIINEMNNLYQISWVREEQDSSGWIEKQYIELELNCSI